MNLDHVESYLAVVRSGSFHGAARARNLSQGSISQHVKKLEASLGVTLLKRDRPRCRPAPRTEPFVQYAEALVSLADRAGRIFSRPTLVVGASSNIGVYLLQSYWRRFHDRHGEKIDARLVIDTNPAIAEKLDASAVDVAVMEWWDGRPGFIAIPWRDEDLVVITPPDHPWARRKALPATELFSVPILGGGSGTGTGRLLRQKLGRRAARLTVVTDLGSTEAVKQAVRNGLGISLVLAGTVSEERRFRTLGVIPVIAPSLRKRLYVVHRKGLADDEPPSRFVHLLLDRNGVR